VTQAGAAAAVLAEWQPHVVILDMELDSRPIMARLGTAAAGARRLPVIGIVSQSDLQTKLSAFAAGVDDILGAPFAPEELLARVAALIRRSYANQATFTPVIKTGELEIDILHRTVRTGTHELALTALERSLLYLLAANAGRIVTRDEILDTLWGSDYVAESNVVDRQIRNLRTRLNDDWRNPRFIATIPRHGYRFLATASPS
jgi:two-component system response regulator RstA